MAKTITITNGTGTGSLVNGSYSVTANVVGYNNDTLSPDNVQITENENEYSFTISANGLLTLHVTEEGTPNGTPIVGATFIRTDAAGYGYGDPITTDEQGDAVFENVPYAETDAPTLYYKQTASDGNHEFDAENQSITLNTVTNTIQIANPAGETRTIRLTDTNYANLAIESGTLTFTN